MEAGKASSAALIPLAEEEDLPVSVRRLLAVTRASFEQCAQLERALEARILVEQAKGVLAERLRVRPDEAFELLRGTARSRQLRVHDLARNVVEKSDTPTAIIAYLQTSLTERAGNGSPTGVKE